MDYKYKVIVTKTPLKSMLSFLRDNVRKYDDMELTPNHRFQIRFTENFYNNHLSESHKQILAKYAIEHSMALCRHYVYQYEDKNSFTIDLKKRNYDAWGYYSAESIGEIVFFDPTEYPKLIVKNRGKQHDKKFILSTKGREKDE